MKKSSPALIIMNSHYVWELIEFKVKNLPVQQDQSAILVQKIFVLILKLPDWVVHVHGKIFPLPQKLRYLHLQLQLRTHYLNLMHSVNKKEKLDALKYLLIQLARNLSVAILLMMFCLEAYTFVQGKPFSMKQQECVE